MESTAEKRPENLVELSSRVVYSLLELFVRTAARFRLALDRLVELTRLAYFKALRRKAPPHDGVARALGASYRTAVSLNRARRRDRL